MGLHKVIGQSQFIALPGAFPCSYNTAVHNNQTAVIILCFRNNGSVIAYRGLHHMLDRFLHKIRKLHIRYSVWNMQCHIPGQDSRGSVKRKKGFTNPAVSTCRRLLKPPYVCNGCGKRSVCSLEKRLYNADFAHREYRDILSESRTGLSYSEDEIRYLDEFISPLIRQNQSPHHICVYNADSLTVSERTIYRLIDSRIISAMNIDLPRKVRYSARKVERHLKVDKVCLADNGTEFSNPRAVEYDR